MAYRKWTAAQKAQAVAYARVEGARAAAERFGMDWRAVRDWAADAGVDLDPGVDRDELAATADVALATIHAEIAAGKIRGTRLATVYGILMDKLRTRDKDKPAPKPPASPGERATDRIEAWIRERWGEDAIDAALSALLRPYDGPSPDTQPPMTDDEAEAYYQEVIAVLEAEGDPVAWLERFRDVERAEALAAPTEPIAHITRLAPVPDDVTALLAEADALLARLVQPAPSLSDPPDARDPTEDEEQAAVEGERLDRRALASARGGDQQAQQDQDHSDRDEQEPQFHARNLRAVEVTDDPTETAPNVANVYRSMEPR